VRPKFLESIEKVGDELPPSKHRTDSTKVDETKISTFGIKPPRPKLGFSLAG
jgi:hypothetical protein